MQVPPPNTLHNSCPSNILVAQFRQSGGLRSHRSGVRISPRIPFWPVRIKEVPESYKLMEAGQYRHRLPYLRWTVGIKNVYIFTMSALNEDATYNGGEQSPPGWKQVGLNEILNPNQLVELQKILNKNRDPEDALKAMKAYFATQQHELEAKGMDGNFLAYMLYAKITGVI
jgi:hypothetical protein